jgi:hypothetical protein
MAATDAVDEAADVGSLVQVDRQPVQESDPANGRYSCIRDDAFCGRESDCVRHSANGRHGKQNLKKTADLRLIKLSRL